LQLGDKLAVAMHAGRGRANHFSKPETIFVISHA
jgi:hypothetical protein